MPAKNIRDKSVTEDERWTRTTHTLQGSVDPTDIPGSLAAIQNLLDLAADASNALVAQAFCLREMNGETLTPDAEVTHTLLHDITQQTVELGERIADITRTVPPFLRVTREQKARETARRFLRAVLFDDYSSPN